MFVTWQIAPLFQVGMESFCNLLKMKVYCFFFLFISSKDSTIEYDDALLYAAGILILNGINTILFNQFFLISSQNGMRARVAVCSIIYRKVSFFLFNLSNLV